MAAPMELCCWGDGWGLPSPHPESLIVMAYAKFSGAPLTVNTINNSWRALKVDVPVLISEDIVISQPAKILNFLRKQKYNADYELSAKQGADTLAFIALLEEKLLPALLHTFWVDAENYCSVTKPWFASRMPFPLGLYLPGKISRKALNRILLTRGAPPFYSLTEVEAQVYRDAKECLNLLSKRLGTSQFFFGDRPTTLDAFVFGFLAPIYKVSFPRVQLQKHLKHLPNLCRFCDDILTCYFRLTVSGHSPAGQDTADANLQKLTQLVNKESNLIEKKNIVVQVRIPTEEGCLSASVHSSKGGGKCLDQNSEMVLQVKMDDNLRKSPQHPPRKLTTLKLAAGGEQSSPLNRLSP